MMRRCGWVTVARLATLSMRRRIRSLLAAIPEPSNINLP
jgi:hypothetical protein